MKIPRSKVVRVTFVIALLVTVNWWAGLDLLDPLFDPMHAIVGTVLGASGNYTSESNLGTMHSVTVKYCKALTSPNDFLIYEVRCTSRTFVFEAYLRKQDKRQLVETLVSTVGYWKQVNGCAVVSVADGEAAKSRLTDRGWHGVGLIVYKWPSTEVKTSWSLFLVPIIPKIQVAHAPPETLVVLPIEGPAHKVHSHINVNYYHGP